MRVNSLPHARPWLIFKIIVLNHRAASLCCSAADDASKRLYSNPGQCVRRAPETAHVQSHAFHLCLFVDDRHIMFKIMFKRHMYKHVKGKVEWGHRQKAETPRIFPEVGSPSLRKTEGPDPEGAAHEPQPHLTLATQARLSRSAFLAHISRKETAYPWWRVNSTTQPATSHWRRRRLFPPPRFPRLYFSCA